MPWAYYLVMGIYMIKNSPKTIDYPKFKHAPIPLWTRIRLWFRRGKYSVDEGPEGKAWVYAKELNGVIYIVESGREI